MITLKDIESLYLRPHKMVHAIKGINLSINKGEIFGILGRKGAGKTTLLKCINLLERPSHGTVIVDACNLSALTNEALRKARLKIGMIFQHVNLVESRTVFDNIALPLELAKASKAHIQETVNTLLNLSGLTEHANAYPESLTLGLKQRVAIARALANKPHVLLCDEITASLDPKSAHAILHLLHKLNQQWGLTIVLMTHDLEVIKSICDRVGILDQGLLVEQNTVSAFFKHPTSNIAKEWIKNAARLSLPTSLRRQLRSQPGENTYPVLRLVFNNPSNPNAIHETTPEGLLAKVTQDYQLKINILQAHLESFGEDTLGCLIVELRGLPTDIQESLDFLTEQPLHFEVLGYVPHDT
jgi:D-methionine transport system ATP-binding protein